MAFFPFSLLATYILLRVDASRLKSQKPHGEEPATTNIVTLDHKEENVLHRMQWWAKKSEPKPTTEKYLLFTQDGSGLNNIRIGWEMSALVAQYTGRTLVLPPANSVYLLDWGRRVTGFLPKALEGGQTKTAMEDLINVPQLKTTLPTLTWEEFEAKTGTTWQQAVDKAQKLEGENFVDCTQMRDYKKITGAFLLMDGGKDNRREGFNCGTWWKNGGPKESMIHEVGDAGYALLTHGFSWHDDAFRIAAKVVNYLGLFKYTALHARYNDFEKNFGKQPKPQEVVDSLEPWLKDGGRLYIASDEPELFNSLNLHGAKPIMWKDLFEDSTNNLLAKERAKFSDERWFKLTGPIEELICVFSKVFVGSDKSSFSGHINAMRIQAEAPNTTPIKHTEKFPVEQVKSNIANWESKPEFIPLPETKGNVFFLQLSSVENEGVHP